MNKDELIEFKKRINELSSEDTKLRNLYLKKLANGTLHGPLTGYPSIDKVFLKWYSDECILSDLPSEKLYDNIYSNNKDNLSGIAFDIFGKEITYGELFEKIEETAKAFKANGVKAGDIVSIAMLSTPEAIYTVLALNKIGAISYMIDPRTKKSEMKKYFDDNNSKFIFVTNLFANKFKQILSESHDTKLVSVSLFSSFFNKKSSRKELKKKNTWKRFLSSGKNYAGETYFPYVEDQPSIVIHSGGTTGFPKGVVMTDKKILASIYQALESGIEFNREDTWLGIMPLFIIYGASTGTFLPLIKGMKIYLEPLFSPKNLPKIIKKKKPVHMTLAPSHFENIIYSEELAEEDMSYVIAPTVGGDSMEIGLENSSNEWLDEHNCEYKVVKGYGSSETCSGVTVCISNECNKIGSVGIPFAKTVISIFDPDDNVEKRYGESGEICVSGPTSMLKYFNDQENTDLVLKVHDDGRVWVHTGDWGYIDEDGMLYVTDRIKRMIVEYSGFKILPSYVEKVVMESNMVEKCVVIGMDDPSHSQGQVPVACLVVNNNNNSEKVIASLRKYLSVNLKDDISMPKEFVIVDEIPMIPTNGKIDVRKLEEIVKERTDINKKQKRRIFSLY